LQTKPRAPQFKEIRFCSFTCLRALITIVLMSCKSEKPKRTHQTERILMDFNILLFPKGGILF